MCDGSVFEEVYPATFEGSWQEAVPYFLTDRRMAVHGRILRCGNCGFVLTSPQFRPEDYFRIYENLTVDTGNAGRERAGRLRFNRLGALVRQHVAGGRLLDLGCGNGAFLREMEDFVSVGFEPRRGATTGTEDLIAGDFIEYCHAEGGDAAGTFDAVTAWDVLEHLPALDSYLAKVNRLLKKDGMFFATLPDIESAAARLSGRRWNCILLEHLWYFSPRTFQRYVARFGFTVVKNASFGFPVDIGTLLERLGQIYGLPVPWRMRWLTGTTVTLPIGLMFVACRKEQEVSA